MDGPVLVTGGTGTLGRVVVDHLRTDGVSVRLLSRRAAPVEAPQSRPTPADARRSRPTIAEAPQSHPAAAEAAPSRRVRPGEALGWATGDLRTGAGIDAAVHGCPVILHCATGPRGDHSASRTLLDAALRASTPPHLVYISIVGIDRVPLRYYRTKLAVEQLLDDSGLPYTILRATQFHDLLARAFAALSHAPVLPVLAATSFQPVDVRDVAQRLAELVAARPAGRVPDFGGPQVVPMAELARAWLGATGRRRPLLPLWLPGAVARGYRAGGHLAPQRPDGGVIFEQYLDATAVGPGS